MLEGANISGRFPVRDSLDWAALRGQGGIKYAIHQVHELVDGSLQGAGIGHSRHGLDLKCHGDEKRGRG